MSDAAASLAVACQNPPVRQDGILPAEQVMRGAPYQIRASDLEDERIKAVSTRLSVASQFLSSWAAISPVLRVAGGIAAGSAAGAGRTSRTGSSPTGSARQSRAVSHGRAPVAARFSRIAVRELLAHGLDYLPLARDHLQRLGDVG